MFENNVVIGKTLNDVWRDSMWCCIKNGIDYEVKGGSYVGQIRRQLPYVTLVVNEPWSRPFTFYTPPGIPSPTTEEKIHEYFQHYIIGNIVQPWEDYTYGQFISEQYERVIEILNKAKGNTNQATMTIGNEQSIFLGDPPCLRTLSFKVVNGRLQLMCYFRSWDLFSGLPENLGGLQLLKELILVCLDFPVADGPIVAFSDGLHIYEQYFPVVNELNVDKIPIKEIKDED